MADFAHRSTVPEWMDGDAVSEADFAACLADLATVNTVTLARPPTLRWLKRAVGNRKRFSLIDVGSGEGDMLRAIARWAAEAGIDADLTGVDMNPRAEPAARAATDPALPIRYVTGNVFDYQPSHPPDFIISSICTHHMTDGEVAQFLAWMDATAVCGWFNNDLRRHWFAYYGFSALAFVAGWHPFVRHDGPVSVARSFTDAEWRALIAASGITPEGVTLQRQFPFRLCVGRIR